MVDLKNPDLHLRSLDLFKPFNRPFRKLLIVGNSEEILTVELCFFVVRKELPEYLSARFFGIAAKAACCVEILIYWVLELFVKDFGLEDQQLSFVILRLIGLNALFFAHKSEPVISFLYLIDKAVKHGRMRINAIFPHFFLGNIWGDNRPCPLLVLTGETTVIFLIKNACGKHPHCTVITEIGYDLFSPIFIQSETVETI